jgi:hypothetical protein
MVPVWDWVRVGDSSSLINATLQATSSQLKSSLLLPFPRFPKKLSDLQTNITIST